MAWKVPILGAAVLAGSAVLCPACVGSSPAPEDGEAWIAVAADAAVAKLDVRGMTCGSCATTARIALERIDGVHDAEVSAETGAATVRYDRAMTQPAQFIAELERSTGYEATLVDDRSAHDVADAATVPVSAPAAPASGER